jgi:hypothetical protein
VASSLRDPPGVLVDVPITLSFIGRRRAVRGGEKLFRGSKTSHSACFAGVFKTGTRQERDRNETGTRQERDRNETGTRQERDRNTFSGDWFFRGLAIGGGIEEFEQRKKHFDRAIVTFLGKTACVYGGRD